MSNIIRINNNENIEVINVSSGMRILVEAENDKLLVKDLTKLKNDFFYLKSEVSRLKVLRKNNNYTVADMAEKLGICKGYYSLLENGKRRLYYDLALKIARIFDMNPDDIFL